MEKEKALAQLLIAVTKLTKEANSVRGETKKTTKEYYKALETVCGMLGVDPKEVDDMI